MWRNPDRVKRLVLMQKMTAHESRSNHRVSLQAPIVPGGCRHQSSRPPSESEDKLKMIDHFLAVALKAASLKIFFTVVSLNVIWLLPEPISPEV